MINSEKIYFFDEGVHTFDFEMLEEKKYKLSGIAHLLLDEKKIDGVFTAFDIAPGVSTLQSIRFDYFRSQMNTFQKKEHVYFIGQHLYLRQMNQECYLNLIREFQTSMNLPIIYYPHRHEVPYVLGKIKEMGITIADNTYSVEYSFRVNQEIPLAIYGFLSSALIGLKQIFQEKVDIGYIYLYLDHDLNEKSNKTKVKKIYKEMERLGIRKINLQKL